MNKKKVVSIIVVCVLAVAIAAALVFFYFSEFKKDDVYEMLRDGNRKDYHLSIRTEGGMMMSDVDVYVYMNNELETLIDYSKTDAEGKAVFNLVEHDGYVIVFSGIPKGYDVNEYYDLKSENTDIVFTPTLITGEDINKARFGIGHVMYDFTFETVDGRSLTLSDILDQKKMVILSFWTKDSVWSVEQLELMNKLYSEYKDVIEIIALNSIDDNETVAAFKEDKSIAYPVVSCSRKISAAFYVTRTPSSFVIDNNGILCLSQTTPISAESHLRRVFDYFTADDYVQRVFKSGVIDLVTDVLPLPTFLEVTVVDKDENPISGVEVKLTSEETDLLLTTDDNGIALYDVTVRDGDKLSMVNYPEGYVYKGQAEITLTEGSFVYTVTLEKEDD